MRSRCSASCNAEGFPTTRTTWRQFGPEQYPPGSPKRSNRSVPSTSKTTDVKILDRLPYSSEPTTVSVRDEAVRVRPYQIVVWVSLNLRQVMEWDPRVP